jgi:hypothetical protein
MPSMHDKALPPIGHSLSLRPASELERYRAFLRDDYRQAENLFPFRLRTDPAILILSNSVILNFSAAPPGRIVNWCRVNSCSWSPRAMSVHWNDASVAEGPDGGGVDTAMLFRLTYDGRLA